MCLGRESSSQNHFSLLQRARTVLLQWATTAFRWQKKEKWVTENRIWHLWQDSTWPIATTKEIANVRNSACSFPVCRPWERRAGKCAKTTESYFKHRSADQIHGCSVVCTWNTFPYPHAHASVYSLVPDLPLECCASDFFFLIMPVD